MKNNYKKKTGLETTYTTKIYAGRHTHFPFPTNKTGYFSSHLVIKYKIIGLEHYNNNKNNNNL